jgi:hypothetical protein
MPERTIAEMDERDVRTWFMKVDLAQARDTYRVVEGILETREQFQPKRKQRSDKGKVRTSGSDVNGGEFEQQPIDLREIAK